MIVLSEISAFWQGLFDIQVIFHLQNEQLIDFGIVNEEDALIRLWAVWGTPNMANDYSMKSVYVHPYVIHLFGSKKTYSVSATQTAIPHLPWQRAEAL